MNRNIKIILAILTSLWLYSCTWPFQPEEPSNEVFEGIVAHSKSSAVINQDGSIWAWGLWYHDPQNNEFYDDSKTPVKVPGIEDAVSIDLHWGTGIAADKAGDIWVWDYADGQFISGSSVTTPRKISHLEGVISVQLYSLDVTLLRDDGTIWYFSRFIYQSPTDPTLNLIEPKQIEGVDRIIQISETMALSADDILYHDGINDTLPGILAIQNSLLSHTLILKDDGTVWAWGENDYGQLGNGTYYGSDEPIQVKNLDRIIAISASDRYNLALREDGTVWFWGLEIGEDSSWNGRSEPIMIEGLSDVKLISANRTNLVMKSDGSFWSFTALNKIPVRIPTPGGD